MHTEITDNATNARSGWIFFDAECRVCVAGRRRWGRLFEKRGYTWLPTQTPGAAKRLGITDEQLMAEMWVLSPGGSPVGGVNAWIELMRHVWWLWPLSVLLRLPGINRLGHTVYRWIARNRYCVAGRCNLRPMAKPGLRVVDVLVLGFIIAAIIGLTWTWPRWAFMWTLGIALGQFGKWLTWRDTIVAGHPTPARLVWIWFLLWPGLDGRGFFGKNETVPRPAVSEWFAAFLKLGLGIGCIWFLTPLTLPHNQIAAGWVAMTGIILCLHFGIFHLLSLIWRAAGINAQPIMKRPLAAVSLADFWGNRWNTAFSIPARRFLFTPLARRHGIVAANLAVFLASGLFHELVISVPAGAGFGIPTAYFAVQGLGVLFEHSTTGHALGLGRGWRGWLFVLIITAAPAFWLFSPTFIHNIILPMLQAIGAT